jgi:flagellar biosynthetic protein FlhB
VNGAAPPRREPYLRFNLRLFDEANRNEPATPKRRRRAREEGQVAKSQEIVTAFSLLAVFFSLRALTGSTRGKIEALMRYCLDMIGDINGEFGENMAENVIYIFGRIVFISMPVMLVAAAAGVFANVAQAGWVPAPKALLPNLSRLNPAKGLKRVFSFRGVTGLLKSLAKFSVLVCIIYSVIKKEMDIIPLTQDMPVAEGAAYAGGIVIEIGVKSGMVFLLIAVADYVYERFRHEKDIRMSKREIKDEYRQTEGNPQVRGQIRQRMREVSARRMIADVTKADVVITNPTHYAVAVFYDRQKASAPVVLAKGADYMARRIKDAAREHGVEIFESAELARALYGASKIGDEIPPELYQAVAEVLAFVYRLKG